MTWSHAPYTDGARIVDGARSKILWGVWETDPQAPILLYYPLSSVLAYLVFALGGLGLWQANLTSVLPGAAALFLVVLLGWKKNWWVAVSAGLIAAINFFLVAYNRLPMCESLMILFMLLVPWLLMREPLRTWQSVAAGLALAAAAFFVKLHALVLLPVTVVWLAVFRSSPGGDSGRQGWKRHPVFFLGGVSLGALLWVLLILLPHADVVGDFLDHNLISQYGKDDADAGGALGFLEERLFGLVGSGTNVRLFGRMPVVGLLAVLATLYFASHWRKRRGRAFWLESFSVLWLVGGITALALLDYRPLRYHLQLIPPAAFLAGLVLARVLEKPGAERAHPAATLICTIFIVFQALIEVPVYMSKHQVGSQRFLSALGLDPRSVFMGLSKLVNSPWLILLLGVLAGLVAVGLTRWLAKRREGRKNPVSPFWARAGLVLVLVALILWIDLSLHRGMVPPRHSLRDVSKDLGEVLGPGAFVVGTAATTLSLENGMKSLPAYGRIAKQRDLGRFETYPITHVLLRDGVLSEFLESDFPAISDSLVFLRRYVIGPAESSLYRVLGWRGAEGYDPTAYERGLGELAAGNWQEAAGELRVFLEAHPGNASATMALGIALEQSGRGREALEKVQEATLLAPEDLAILCDAGAAFARYGRVTEAAGMWRRVLSMNPRDARAHAYLQALQSNLQRTGESRP
jgi:hypothetical protein